MLRDLFMGIAVISMLTACAAVPERKVRGARYVTRHTVSSAGESRVKDLLYLQLRDWKHVQYRNGGLSKEGVDCSGFVYLTFMEKFDTRLPRSTTSQARIGSRISRGELMPGDLVFFRTGVFSRHVGIYVEKGKFLHVSKKKGVVLSSLMDQYWSGKYWQSRRVKAGRL